MAILVLLVLVLGVPVIAVVLYKKKCERTDHLSISPSKNSYIMILPYMGYFRSPVYSSMCSAFILSCNF